jgi:hypothetical protein
LLQWLGEAAQAPRVAGPQAQLLKRVFGEQLEVRTGQPAPWEKEEALVMTEQTREATQGRELVADRSVSESTHGSATASAEQARAPAVPSGQTEFAAEGMKSAVPIEPQGKDQRHRTLVVGEHPSALQARRQEQQTEAFQQRRKHRHGIEGTQSELVRGHGLRRARYRGLAEVKLQNYLIGAACKVKRWIRREAWKLAQAVSVGPAEVANAATA